MKQKEKLSTASKVSSSRNRESNNSSDLSHVADRTLAKRTQQLYDDLTKGLDEICITENTALSIQEISECCLVGG